ncbi:MAG: NADH:flavin oxidoreductase [Deltaproteobacteria bacterium]|jgi:2,4-dienoyl-CoA reductase-like NADH-dependent reductase (Old Yellow Enzyme family)|nr:NADH:flavin oxidoreductase [Deltaproteobacteria bacterium]
MTALFEPSEIKGMKLQNRFVRSATWEGLAAENGSCTPRLVGLMETLAKGGVGLIISSHAYVQKVGQAGTGQLGIHTDDMIPGLKEMTAAVHSQNGKIVCQLAHAGFFGNEKLSGQTPMAPSAIDGIADGMRKEMTPEDIQRVIAAFEAAARRAKIAGFDGLQIHAAHGYLLSEFISPMFNHRTDEYGGSIQNRARLPLAVLQAIREAVGAAYPVLIKMNCKDFTDEGLQPAEFVQVGKMLADAGIDAIEVSGGLPVSPKTRPSQLGINKEEKEAYFQEEARALRKETAVTLILVGGNRSFHVAERLVAEGVADYISMSRPLIREPHLINRWKAGDLTKAACVSDNMCFQPAIKGEGIYCVTEKREQAKQPTSKP